MRICDNCKRLDDPDLVPVSVAVDGVVGGERANAEMCKPCSTAVVQWDWRTLAEMAGAIRRRPRSEPPDKPSR